MTKKFDNLIKLIETSMSGGEGSVFGALQSNPTPQFSSDFYASGDARVPMSIYGMQHRRKKRRKKKKLPMLKRTHIRGL